MKKFHRNRAFWQKSVLSVLCVVLTLVLVALIFVTAYAESLLNRINRPGADYTETYAPSQYPEYTGPSETIDPNFTGPTINPNDLTLPTLPPDENTSDPEHIINILLIGQDRRDGEPRQRSDSMILCTFNTRKKTINMTSFLRDTYVTIPGHSYAKLNAAYQWGGMPLLNETLAVNFGVQVDANVEVDFQGFMGIIDLLGGVDINLTAAEAKHMNSNGDWMLWDGQTPWELKEGPNRLNAKQALSYSRIRAIGNDFGRANRQRTVIMALIQEYKNQSWDTMLKLLYDILPLITTDMTNAEIVSYAAQLFPLLSGGSISTLQIPASGAYYDAVINNDQVLVPDLIANRQLLKNTILAD